MSAKRLEEEATATTAQLVTTLTEIVRVVGKGCTQGELGAILYSCRQADNMLKEIRRRISQQAAKVEAEMLKRELTALGAGDSSYERPTRWEDEDATYVASILPKLEVPTLKRETHPEVYEKLADLCGLSKEARDTECFRPHYPGVQEFLGNRLMETGETPFQIPSRSIGGQIRITRRPKK